MRMVFPECWVLYDMDKSDSRPRMLGSLQYGYQEGNSALVTRMLGSLQYGSLRNSKSVPRMLGSLQYGYKGNSDVVTKWSLCSILSKFNLMGKLQGNLILLGQIPYCSLFGKQFANNVLIMSPQCVPFC